MIKRRIRELLLVCSAGLVAASVMGVVAIGSVGAVTTNWTPSQDVLSPPPASSTTLLAVSCESFGNCTAVGQDASGPMVITEHNGAWGQPTDLTATSGGYLQALSCPDQQNCVAVGYVYDSGYHPVWAQEAGGVWSQVTEVSSEDAFLSSVSCWSAGNCAFGGNGTGLSSSAIYTFSAGTMATPPTTLTDPAANSFIRSISCVSSSECTVVGADDNGWATANLSGSGWSALGNPAGAPAGGELYSVACPSSGHCTAVGLSGSGTLNWLSGSVSSWGAPGQVASSNGGSPSISCADASNCQVVVGNPYTHSDTFGEVNGIWDTAVTPFSNSDPIILSSVSCATDQSCTAVGALDQNRQVPIFATYPVNFVPPTTTTAPTTTTTAAKAQLANTGLMYLPLSGLVVGFVGVGISLTLLARRRTEGAE